jgi:hypothetical protein
MQQQNALYALLIGVEATALDYGSTVDEVMTIIRTTNLEDHPFFQKVKKLLAASVEKFGVNITAKEYGLPVTLLNKIK